VRRTGISNHTILRWAKQAGIDNNEVNEGVAKQHATASAAAAARTFRERQEARERMVNRLIRVSEAALLRELEILTRGEFTRDDLQALTNARMKAIQQFELLEGRASSRIDFGQEQILEAVSYAFQKILEIIPGELRDMVSGAFADELRKAREESTALALEAPVEDAEFTPIEPVTEA
jgi:hypothetical protein